MKRLQCWLVVFLLLICSSAAVNSQEPAYYVLGAGDTLQVTVWGHEDLSQIMTIRPDGRISFPLLGDVEAQGLAPSALAEALATGLAEYVRNPNVTVVVKEFRTIGAQVLGQVRAPGLYKLPPTAGIADAIAAAGGLTPDADAARVRLISNSSGSTQLNLEPLFASGDQTVNRQLADGDQVVVPELRKVTVLGEVRTPGIVSVKSGDGVAEVLARAGGPTSDADLAHVQVTNQPADGTFPAIAIMDLTLGESDSLAGLPTSGGLEIRVPKAIRQVTVLGQVVRPGAYPIGDATRLMEVIGASGGPTERAALDKVRVYRGENFTNPEEVVVGQGYLLFEGDAKDNPRVITGDVVFVPETKKTNWDKAIKLFTGLNLFKDLFN